MNNIFNHSKNVLIIKINKSNKYKSLFIFNNFLIFHYIYSDQWNYL